MTYFSIPTLPFLCAGGRSCLFGIDTIRAAGEKTREFVWHCCNYSFGNSNAGGQVFKLSLKSFPERKRERERRRVHLTRTAKSHISRGVRGGGKGRSTKVRRGKEKLFPSPSLSCSPHTHSLFPFPPLQSLPVSTARSSGCV